jgi:S-adenosylmethionine synthetase
MSYLFTSESVSEGHPDKVADAISDAILDLAMRGEDPSVRCACETLVTTNSVIIAGEFKNVVLHPEEVDATVRKTIKNIGYEQAGFDWQLVHITNLLHGQSADIALGTDNFGAGDQGLMFGYATNKTPNYMPPTIYYSHKIMEALAKLRKDGATWLGPDAKAQVTLQFNDDHSISHATKIVCSTQHSEDTDIATVRANVENIIRTILPAELINDSTEFLINPTGRFVIGGPDGDTGLTGRKIIVDTYGGACPHGGGAFSGKDPTKVDRSAAYMARYLAKNIVATGRATWATVQLAYAIGVEQPMSVYVDSDGNNQELTEWITKYVDLTPRGIINRFNLFRPIYSSTTNYGHFGKDGLPWEELDLFEDQ